MKLSDVRRAENRCRATLVEWGKAATSRRRRSWRCQLVEGHAGTHWSLSGHRRWDGPVGVTENAGPRGIRP